MTTLALVINSATDQIDDDLDCLVETDSPDTSPYTKEEKAIYKDFVKYLKARGMCKLDDATSRDTRLFNRFARQPQSMSYIENKFRDWLRDEKPGKKCRMPKTSYITRTLNHVVGSQFVPNGGDYWNDCITDYTYANTYRGYKPTTNCTEVSPLFTQFFERLIHVEAERKLFLQWLAHMFQFPQERPSWHIMLTSSQGTGKGWLLEKIIHPLLHHTQVISSYAKLTGQFSTTLEDTLFVLLDDCKARSETTQTMLKSSLSEERAYVERKNAQGGMVKTYTRFMLASNEEVPLDFDEDERRWVPLTRAFHSVSKVETQAHIKKTDDWLALPGSLDAVYRFFMSYNLAGFNPKSAPQTTTLLEMVRKGKGLQNEIFNGFIKDKPVFTFADLVEVFTGQSLKAPSTQALADLLQSAGYVSKQPRINGEKVRVCHPRGMSLITIRGHMPPKPPPAF